MRSSSVLSMLTLSLLLGCGGGSSNTVPVTGIVTLDGQPLDGAALTFYSESGGLGGMARSGTDGKFEVMTGDGKSEGLAPGQYKVTVSKMKGDPNAGGGDGAAGAVTEIDMKNDLPPIYSNRAKSKLSFTISKDGPPIEIKLESPKKKK